MTDAMNIRYLKQSWLGKKWFLKMGFRMAMAKLRKQNWLSAGAALQGRMLQASLKAGVDVRINSGVSELIEENGEITGVVTTKDGKPWRIGSKLGVLINAGGFSHNQRMRDKYQPGTQAAWSQVPKGDTGEMIEEMMRHGAAIAQMEEMVGFQTFMPPGTENNMIKPGAQNLTAAPHVILVDQSGVRYMNEGGSYMLYCQNMLERNKTVGAVPSWGLFDSQYVEKYGLANSLAGGWKLKDWVASGYFKKADTIEGLAGQINVPPATLRATIERFNGFVAKGSDDDFHRGDRAYDNFLGDPYNKPSNTLGTLEQGPFYAVPIVPGDVGTYGGVVTDENARVLREDGSVIPGLYATGISTASVMGRVYPGAGSSVGPSFVWGFVAATHAAGAGNMVGVESLAA
jgi:3-oxosteroid 1-dehydrogenase